MKNSVFLFFPLSTCKVSSYQPWLNARPASNVRYSMTIFHHGTFFPVMIESPRFVYWHTDAISAESQPVCIAAMKRAKISSRIRLVMYLLAGDSLLTVMAMQISVLRTAHSTATAPLVSSGESLENVDVKAIKHLWFMASVSDFWRPSSVHISLSPLLTMKHLPHDRPKLYLHGWTVS